MLEEAPPREGFFEKEHVESVLKHLPNDFRRVVEVFYETGWRKREVLDFEWSRVDLKAGTVILAEGSTKSGDARKVFFTPKLREVFEARDWERKKLARRGIITPLVFFRMKHGKPAPVRDLRKV
jgi:integrase